jgi:hypothetical protein
LPEQTKHCPFDFSSLFREKEYVDKLDTKDERDEDPF